MKKITDLVKQYSIPILILFVITITVGSLWPRLSRHYQTGEISSGLVPKEGDNFKMVNIPHVYRLEGGKRRQWSSDTSFFNHGNPPFDTPVDQGGILICDKEVVLSFPQGDYMPKEQGEQGKVFVQLSTWETFKKGCFRRDKVTHFFSYAIFALLCMFLFEQHSQLSKGRQYALVLFLGTLLGGGIEYLQFEFIPGRDKEWLDLAFNSLGLVAGIVVAQKWNAILGTGPLGEVD